MFYLYVSLFTTCMPVACRHKRVLEIMELKLQIVMNCDLGTGDSLKVQTVL